MTVDISILLPAYNAQQYIESSVGSALGQSLANIEVIVVDDASTDATAALLSAMTMADSRLKIISHERNRGPGLSLQTGLEHASGAYCLIMAADDELMPTACAQLLAEIQAEPVDILHFDIEFVMSGKHDAVVIEHMSRFLCPPNVTLSGIEIARSAFEKVEHCWNAAGKLVRTDLCRAAYRRLPNRRLLLGEDLLAYFYICYTAESYRGLPEHRYYRYNYGRGNSNWQMVAADSFQQRWLAAFEIVRQIRDFLDDHHELARYGSILASIRGHLLVEAMNAVLTLVYPEQRAKAFFSLAKTWPMPEVVALLAYRCWDEPLAVRKWLFDTGDHDCVPARGDKTACYAFDPNILDGACWADLSLRAGSTQEARPLLLIEGSLDNSHRLPDGFDCRTIQAKYPSLAAASYGFRCHAIINTFKKYDIGRLVVLNHAQSLIFWDLLLCYCAGIVVEDAQGNDLTKKLLAREELERVLSTGMVVPGFRQNTNHDFNRECYGQPWALLDYRQQAAREDARAQSLSYRLGRALTFPLRQAVRLFGSHRR
ncbi:MAG: glycosyltransferase family 2 protein [Coriobacteriales bacterium]|jgi:glycosyltransferase involved in cell wall biosynthesis|nr:glycosyltransferase family 2 protein [Coriobacteriales bacterium]